ncbi:hypothetical protein QBC35DRAFT_498688 [Podospora australis]|uniref:Uncharacterized protein n=1 Tax=Podospora australis TaxID=1536484 RepID=A0AAN6WTQ5_9PEZI|nr:hypothetical protein QBC35DRAFT_498688 [Podospora australis]
MVFVMLTVFGALSHLSEEASAALSPGVTCGGNTGPDRHCSSRSRGHDDERWNHRAVFLIIRKAKTAEVLDLLDVTVRRDSVPRRSLYLPFTGLLPSLTTCHRPW